MSFAHKRITDPVHGTISLSKLESDVTSSRAFQRLHNIRQLGLAHLVFPGANYSRFSHSVGALHNATLMLEGIKNSGHHVDDGQIQAVRLAALLHDVGHYPFSHATEHVIADHYTKQQLFSDSGEPTAVTSSDRTEALTASILPSHFDHETLGGQIVDHDQELNDIFQKNNFSIQALKDVYQPGPANSFLPIVSSDLDCDRLDYLRRTAHFSGAPYGSVDIRFLAGSSTLDSEGQFCFTHKAMRAADHLLVSRYYDYVQIPFHKTVAGLEWSLVSGLEACLKQGLISCSAEDMIGAIKDGSWSTFDDQHIVSCFRSIRGGSTDLILNDHLDGIINRRPPKMVAAWEGIGQGERSAASQRYATAKAAKNTIAEKLGCDPARIHIWQASKTLSSLRSDEELTEASAKAVHILDPRTQKARPLVQYRDALLNSLSKYEYSGVRVYLLPEASEGSRSLRVAMSDAFEDVVGPATTATVPR